MQLPVMPPLKPMLAKARPEVPDQPDPSGEPVWLYEPKWDGFRCIVFRDGDEVLLGSRNLKPLDRYFPEVLRSALAELPPRVVLDGELVVPRERDGRTRLDWEALSQRIHPAASRIALLSEQTPAQIIAFDCLALDDEDLLEQPLARRRAALESVFERRAADGVAGGSVHLSIATTDAATARGWFATFEGAGLDGVVAKRLDGPYRPDVRDMIKIKHHRTADCVVVGYRRHKSVDGVGSLLLGLYDGDRLHMVGGASAFPTTERRRLLQFLQDYRVGADVTAEGEKNRWNAREDSSFVPLRPELVVEVEYDQMEGDRLRHAGRVLRWRSDKDPAACGYNQLEVPVRYDLSDVLAR